MGLPEYIAAYEKYIQEIKDFHKGIDYDTLKQIDIFNCPSITTEEEKIINEFTAKLKKLSDYLTDEQKDHDKKYTCVNTNNFEYCYNLRRFFYPLMNISLNLRSFYDGVLTYKQKNHKLL